MAPVASRRDGSVTCQECGTSFQYYLIHNGFNQSAHAYCEACGRTLVLGLPFQSPSDSAAQGFGSVTAETEGVLPPCPCGGRFRGDATPRCPSCCSALSATSIASQIEANASGSRKRWWQFWERPWRWQNSWQGLYALIVDDRRLSIDWPKNVGK